jgi:hypothetical protein
LLYRTMDALIILLNRVIFNAILIKIFGKSVVYLISKQ